MMLSKESQAEDLIADFLDEKGIDCKRHYKISNLENDDKFFREADFYLPKYKIYIEFLGQWNFPDHKARYKQKMAIYHKNNIPCIYLWPDNLGTLDWMFKRRLREVLIKHNRTRDIALFEVGEFWKEHCLVLICLVFLFSLGNNFYWKIFTASLGLIYIVINVRDSINTLKKIKKDMSSE